MAISSVTQETPTLKVLSTDVKPTQNVTAKTILVETDTGNVYEYTGSKWIKVVSAGYIRTASVENSSGSLSAGKQALNTTTTYSFPNGLEGVTVENFSLAAATQNVIYVAFNNYALSDVTLDGLRHEIGPNSAKPFTFTGDTKPTQMTIAVPNSAGVSAHYTAAEVV